MSPKTLSLTALVLCGLACQLTSNTVASAPQVPATPTETPAVEGGEKDPTEMKEWLLNFAMNADPQGFCLETCEALESCQILTDRFPGQTASFVRAQCEVSCKTDPAMRDRFNALGSSGALINAPCDLEPDLQKTLRLRDTFACDQQYCEQLKSTCGVQYGTYEDQNACIESCLDFGTTNKKSSSVDPTEVGINCLIEGAKEASDAASCSLALVKNTTCLRE